MSVTTRTTRDCSVQATHIRIAAPEIAIDAIGLIPEGGGASTIARKIGNFNGYRGIVADNFGKAAIEQVHGAKDTFSVTQGAGKGDWVGTGLGIVGFITGLGQAAAVGEMAWDIYKGSKESDLCH